VKAPHVQLVPPPGPAAPWWDAPEFLALSEVRRAMVRGEVPVGLPGTAEEHARHALFWALYEIEHVMREYARRLAAGEPVRMRHGIYKHHPLRVDFNIRIVEDPGVTITERS
jgi:hypothetical protein